MDENEIYNYLLENCIVGEEALDLITDINGFNEETLNDILFAKTGYRDMEQYLEYEDKETYNEYYGEEEEEEDEE